MTTNKPLEQMDNSLALHTTLTGHLETILTSFPQNDGERTVRIWLPESYNPARKVPYPVIYAWDGQNLFDRKTATYGKEWQLDETLTALHEEYVVIGFDSSQGEYNGDSEDLRRYREYSGLDWIHPTVGKIVASGSETVDFVVDQLLPMLEQQYNISPNPTDRILMGSSMGGYLTLFAMSYQPGVFATALALSHATGDHYGGQRLRQYFRQHGFADDARLYLDMGTQEHVAPWHPDDWLAGHHAMVAALNDVGIEVQQQVITDGVHDETAWAKRFSGIFQRVIKEWHCGQH